MKINEFINNYNLHDSILEKAINNSNDNTLEMEIELCNWKQSSFVEGQPEMLKLNFIFKGVSMFCTEPCEYRLDDDDILEVQLSNDGMLKIVTRNDFGINVFSIVANSVEL